MNRNYEREFQFHKGAIRTDELTDQQLDQFHFNSIKVRLEPPDPAPDPALSGSFQFHKGAIRTFVKIMFPVNPETFQFHKGAIRT